MAKIFSDLEKVNEMDEETHKEAWSKWFMEQDQVIRDLIGHAAVEELFDQEMVQFSVSEPGDEDPIPGGIFWEATGDMLHDA